MTDRNARLSPLTTLGDGILLLCAMTGFTLSFLSLYGGQGSVTALPAAPLDLCAVHADSFLGLTVLYALAALCVWSLPRFRGTAAGGLALLWSLLAFFNRKALLQGAAVTVRAITVIFSQRVSWGRVLPYESGLTPTEEGLAVRLFLTLTLALLALVLGWAVARARRWWLVLLLTLPPLLPGLLADLYPSWPPFMALAACWCAMLLTDLCKWAAPDRRGILTLTVLPCVAAVLAAITLAFPREGYTRPGWALRAETRLSGAGAGLFDFFSRFDGPFHNTVTYVGAAEEADLAHAGPLRYSGRTVLRIFSDCPDRLYLRGASLAVYEDGVWKAPPGGTWQAWEDGLGSPDNVPSPLILPALTAEHKAEYTITVDNVGAVGACVYAPYFLTDQDWAAAGALPMQDSYLARLQGQWAHTMTFASLRVPEPSAGRDAVYRDYVYDHYLDVPDELRSTLAELYDERYRGIVSYSPVTAAQDVAALLDKLCEYDQSAPAAPEGTDPVEYFLSESRRGYCMHFASAAALMLRTLGVPARYVSGFTAVPQPGRQVNVPDRAAHAWVEVWINGFGWYPVEVTPASALEWHRQGEEPPSEALPSAPAEESGEPEPTPAPDDEPAPSAAPTLAGQEETGTPAEGPAAGPDWTALADAIKALAAVAGLAALLWLAQFLPKRFRAGKLSAPDRNRAALDGYGYLLRMKRWGGRVDQRAVELAQKAKFSQHTLTQEELDELRSCVDRERERLCVVLGPAARLMFRYLWGMPRPKPGTEPSQENSE